MNAPRIKHILPNLCRIDIGKHSFFFSYETCVAVDDVCSKNIWSTTTGKHLNIIEPDHDRRVPYEKLLEYVNNIKSDEDD